MKSNEPTRRLQAMMADRAHRAEVLAITSGKGGVGKTNIAANLAICLAAAAKKVVLMDADLGLGNLDVIMNVSGRYSLSHVVSGHRTLDQIIEVGPAGVEILCGGSGLEELANLSRFQRTRLIDEMATLQDRADMIIIDTGAGIGASVLSFCQAADHTLVVTTPEPTAMTDAYAVIKVLAGKQYPGRISLIVNMADSVSEGKKTQKQMAEVVRRFLDTPLYDAGILCRDERLVAAVRRREPVALAYPHAQVTGALVAMAARLARGPAAHTTDNFFRKVVNWFF